MDENSNPVLNSSHVLTCLNKVRGVAKSVTSNLTTQPEEGTYITEPQSGAIFIMTNPSSALKNFPLTVTELVDISLFSFSGDEGHRMFVGRKETSLLLIELGTGKIKATMNTECPWDPFDDEDVDLDELEGSKPSPSEVFIGRETNSRVGL